MHSIKWEVAAALWIRCLTSILLSGVSAQTTIGTEGVAYPCPTSLSPGCYCYNPRYTEVLGWSITCTDENGNMSYSLQYGYSDPRNPSSDSQYSLSCGTSQPLVEGFFRRYSNGHGGEQTRNFEFHNCSLSLNVSLVDVFDGQFVQSLSFECDTCRPDSVVSQETGWTFETLESLTLNKYNLSELPANIFPHLVNLKRLVLNGDQIRDLPENLFANQSKLKILDLYDNLLETLPENLFRKSVTLKKLRLNNNRLKEVNGETFRYLSSLEELHLGNNTIDTIKADAFQYNKNLKILVLSENKLRTLLPETFASNTALTFLDLRSNTALSHLPDTLGAGIVSLQEFHLSQCNISNIPGNLLVNAHNLTTLEVSANSVETIPSGLLANSNLLSSLDLSKNRIASLPSDVFLKNPSLKFLSLAYNRFTKFPPNLLQNLEQLEELHLEGNMLSEFGNLDGLSSLAKISLQNNEIRKMLGRRQPFGRTINLSLIDLSHNRLQDFLDLDWNFYSSLKTLNLQYNEITSLDVTIMTLREIDVHLENNNISSVFVKDVEQADNMSPVNHDAQGADQQQQNLYLKDNPLNCDCHMLEFQRYVKSMASRKTTRFSDGNDLICSSPNNLANVSFITVTENEFVCQIVDSCPRGCTCVLRSLYSTTEVTCAKLNLGELPDVLPVNTSVLNFQGNSLKSLAGLRKPIWGNLTVLIVDDNDVTSEGLYLPKSLRSLSIQRNALTVVSNSLATWAGTAQSLSLEGNPWICDCAGLPLKQLLTDQYRIIPDRDKVLCSKPKSLFQKSVDSLQEKDLCPNDKSNSGAYITAISVCVPILVVTFVLCVVYFRNRRMIIAYIYIHCYKIFAIFFRESDMDEDKPFHAFVSYSSSDSDLTKALVAELEKKEPYFRLCIHERDWLPGQLITWNIVRSVQNSRRTILILSRDFLKSVWFQLEFHIAYYQMLEDKVDRLIVVVNGDLPDKAELDVDLQFLLSTKSYLIWNERWFWEKLRYALPHKRGPAHVPPRKPEVQGPSSELLQKIEGKIMSLTQKSVEILPCVKEEFSVELDEMPRNGQACPVLQPNTCQTDSSSI